MLATAPACRRLFHSRASSPLRQSGRLVTPVEDRCWGSFLLTPTAMPIHPGAPMDENLLGVKPMVIFTATYGLPPSI